MDITHREYVEQWQIGHDLRHTEHQREHEREHRQTADAVGTAREASDRRFDTIAATLDRVQSISAQRTDEHYGMNLARIEAVEKIVANLMGRFWALGIGVTILTVILNVVLPLLKAR